MANRALSGAIAKNSFAGQVLFVRYGAKVQKNNCFRDMFEGGRHTGLPPSQRSKIKTLF
jgi:hypothetical protein